jgi:hypothetical protein
MAGGRACAGFSREGDRRPSKIPPKIRALRFGQAGTDARGARTSRAEAMSGEFFSVGAPGKSATTHFFAPGV